MIELDDPSARGPGPRPAKPPSRFTVPAGAWDTHAHVIGAPPEFPLAPDRNYTSPPASAYVKLSGGLRISAEPYPHMDVAPLASRILELAPDRAFWASDWPHVGLTGA